MKNPVTAGPDGKWSLKTQYLSDTSDGQYRLAVLPAEDATKPVQAKISGVERVDFRQTFLAPAGTAAFAAALLLLLFFHPPETAKRREDVGPVATGALTAVQTVLPIQVGVSTWYCKAAC